jgi:hypothetical protein
MNGETKTWVRVQTALKAEVRYVGLPPAPQIEEVGVRDEIPYTFKVRGKVIILLLVFQFLKIKQEDK